MDIAKVVASRSGLHTTFFTCPAEVHRLLFHDEGRGGSFYVLRSYSYTGPPVFQVLIRTHRGVCWRIARLEPRKSCLRVRRSNHYATTPTCFNVCCDAIARKQRAKFWQNFRSNCAYHRNVNFLISALTCFWCRVVAPTAAASVMSPTLTFAMAELAELAIFGGFGQ